MKTKLPLSSYPSTKSVINGNGIFTFLFILFMTVSSFGQVNNISFSFCGGTVTFGQEDGRDENGFPYWINGTDNQTTPLEGYTLYVENDGGTPTWAMREPGTTTNGVFPDVGFVPGPRYYELTVFSNSICGNNWVSDTSTQSCTLVVICSPINDSDNDNDGYYASIDCNDTDASIFPGATEICDGIDNNCNGEVDENLTNCGNDPDNDGDGFNASVDCNDNDATVNTTTTYYVDADGDGYGTTAEDLCETIAPAGYATVDGDCDDNDATEFPGQTWYLGVDNDGDTYFGSQLTADCENPGGYSLTPPTIDDCDDSNTAIYFGAPEVCDGFDNNCDGEIDEGLTDCDDNQDIYEYCGDKAKENKVIICHNGKDKCVNINALDAHLAHGDILGSCSTARSTNNVDEIIEESPTTFDVAYWPNPSRNNFNIKMITPNSIDKVSIEAFDIKGRLVHSKLINGNTDYQFGNNLSAGIYIVKLTQESTTKMIKLVKQ